MSIETLCRKAREQELFIRKSPNHITGGYMIVDENNIIQTGELCGLSITKTHCWNWHIGRI